MPEETITLLVLMWIAPKQFSMMMDFLVVKVPSIYNTILRKASLRMAQVVIPTNHIMVKFPAN